VSAKACHMAKRRVGVKYSPSYAGARAPRGSVTRQGVVLINLQSLLDCQKNFSLSVSLSLSLSLSLPCRPTCPHQLHLTFGFGHCEKENNTESWGLMLCNVVLKFPPVYFIFSFGAPHICHSCTCAVLRSSEHQCSSSLCPSTQGFDRNSASASPRKPPALQRSAMR